MTGRWMDAAEAKHWGLANHVVPKGQAMAKAREIARQLADGPPLLFPAIKQLLRHTEMIPEHQAFELHDSLDIVQQVIRSDDLKEGTERSRRSASRAGPASKLPPGNRRRLRPCLSQRWTFCWLKIMKR